MRFSGPICLVTLAVALTGCPEYDRYRIELKPDGNALQRDLTCWRVRSDNGNVIVIPFSPSALAKIEKAYTEKPTQDKPQQYRFKGRFVGQMPQDIGGSGTHFVVESPLGGVHAYVERFRGDDDLVGHLEKLAEATNRLTDLLVGWLESQMREDANWPKVREFLDGEFRRDVHNLALYIWLARANASSAERPKDAATSDRQAFDALCNTSARLAQYLLEHGYLDLDGAMEVVRDLGSVTEENYAEHAKRLGSYAQRILAKKCDIEPSQAARSLAFLLDAKEVLDSFDRFVKQTPAYAELSRAWSAKGQPPPDAGDVLGHIILDDVLHFDLFHHADEVDVSLATAEEPVATNGQWDEAAAHVQWQRSIDPGDTVATLCFAAWCQPDVAFQENHFGHVILRKNELAEYIASYTVLDANARMELDQFIDALKRGGEVKTKIYGFAFEHRQTNPSLANIGKMLADAIEKVE